MDNNDQNIAQTTALIAKDFEISIKENQKLDEETLLNLLSEEIAHMITHKLDALLSLMYRLDVDERKINKALQFPEEPANIALARLILERQKQRVYSKNTYKPPIIEDWDDFE